MRTNGVPGETELVMRTGSAGGDVAGDDSAVLPCAGRADGVGTVVTDAGCAVLVPVEASGVARPTGGTASPPDQIHAPIATTAITMAKMESVRNFMTLNHTSLPSDVVLTHEPQERAQAAVITPE